MADREEHPVLGKSYEIGNDANNQAFPVIGVAYDPRKGGYSVPAVGTAHPDTANYPTHVFIKDTPTSSDRRVIWEYHIMPGPITTSTIADSDTGALITVTKQNVLTGTVSPSVSGLTIADGVSAIDSGTQERNKQTLALPSSWEMLSTLGVTYHEHFISFVYLGGLGTNTIFRPAKNRSVIARHVFTMTNGEQSAPASLWNDALASWRFWLGFNADNVYSDGGTYSGTANGISFSQAYPASSPTSTAYLALVAANTEVLYNWESKRYKGGVYANKATYVHLL